MPYIVATGRKVVENQKPNSFSSSCLRMEALRAEAEPGQHDLLTSLGLTVLYPERYQVILFIALFQDGIGCFVKMNNMHVELITPVSCIVCASMLPWSL